MLGTQEVNTNHDEDLNKIFNEFMFKRLEGTGRVSIKSGELHDEISQRLKEILPRHEYLAISEQIVALVAKTEEASYQVGFADGINLLRILGQRNG